MARIIRYFTKGLLMEAARNADKWGFNKKLNLVGVDKLPDVKFPVTQEFPHNDDHIRATIALNEQGDTVVVDIPWGFYNLLPKNEVTT